MSFDPNIDKSLNEAVKSSTLECRDMNSSTETNALRVESEIVEIVEDDDIMTESNENVDEVKLTVKN